MSEPKAAPSAGRRTRGRVARVRLEGEARRATALSSAGRAVPASTLSSTEPAKNVAGTGMPLPTAIQERLEAIFEADLARVRVHHAPFDMQGQRGLAAGTHVYLGPGEGVERAQSFPVLAHEVAHVLQQTAVTAADGRVEARPAQGSAEPFAWEAPFVAPTSPPSLEILLEAWHQTAVEQADTEAESHIVALQAASAAASDPVVFWTARAEHVVARTPDPVLSTAGATLWVELPQLAMAALYDGLKRMGHSAAAAHVLREDEGIPTRLRDPATYVAFVGLVGEEHLLERIMRIWQQEPVLGDARPGRALALSASWLIGSYNEVPKLVLGSASGRTTYLLDDLEQTLADAGFISPNELLTAALLAIYALEVNRVRQLQVPADGARVVVTADERLDTRVTIAAHLVGWAAAVQEHAAAIRAGTEPSIFGGLEARILLVRDLAPALGALGTFALDFWRLGVLVDAVSRGERAEAAAARGLDAGTLLRIGASPEPFPGLAAGWLAQVQAFFPRAADGLLPAPSDYAARARTGVREVDALTELVRQRVRDTIRAAYTGVPGSALAFDRSRIGAEHDPLLAMAAWLLVGFRHYRARLDAYDKTADEAFGALWGPRVPADPSGTSWPGEDVRVLHRGRVARSVLELSVAAGLAAVADLVRPVTSASESWARGAQEQDVLAIAQPYRPEPDTPISRLVDDQGANPIAGWEQFRVGDLVTFFQGDHYRRLSARIDQLLGGAEGARFELDQIPIINQARATEQQSALHPLRHSVDPDGFIYLHRNPDAAAPSEAPRDALRLLIEHHPVTRYTVRDWRNYLVPANQLAPELVLWRLPDPVSLARFLRAIPEVNQLLARFAIVHASAGQASPSAEQFSHLSDAEWWDWWTRLTETEVGALERRRVLTLKAIPEVSRLLARYAAEDIVPPNHVPSEAELALLRDDGWFAWFARLTDVGDDALWVQRVGAFQSIEAVNVTLAGLALAQAAPGDTSPSAAELSSLGRSAWLGWWGRLVLVGASRRELLSNAIASSDLSTRLADERTAAWTDLWAAQRRAMVHERERIIRTRVEPMLRAQDSTTDNNDMARINGRRVRRRGAAETALEDLQHYFLYRIDDTDERAAHQAAAALRIAPLLREKLVREESSSETGWTLLGWDRDVALWWLPFLAEVLDRVAGTPALDPWLRDDEPAATFVPERTRALENVYDGMVWALREHQSDFGITAVGGDGTIENPGAVYEVGDTGHTNAFGPGHSFRIDGVTWEVTEVVTPFTFHPAVVRRDGGEILGSRLIIGGEVRTFDGATVLLRVDRDGERIEVKNDPAGDALLRELSNAVAMASITEQLLAMNALMEEGTMFAFGLALDIVALFPVAGQAAEVLRVTTAVGRVVLQLANPDSELRHLIEALTNDPIGALHHAWELVTTNLRADHLVTTLLLDPGLERLENLSARPGPATRSVGGATTSRIGRILRRLASIGRSIIGALARVVGFAHDIRDDAQALVFEHLLLGRALAFVAEHLRFLADLPSALADLPGTVLGTVKEQFDGLIGAIGRIRVPGQLVTLDDIINLLLDLIARSLGGKYQLGYTVVRGLLQHVGLWDSIVAQLSGAIRDALDFDPAELVSFWATFINDTLAPYVRGAQNAVRSVLSPIYTALPGVGDDLAEVPSEPLNIATTGEQFLDTAPQERPGATPARTPERVELSGGRPLDEDERARFQRQFGQDVSHVRVHADLPAARATDAAGARALTTGSHVLLAPDVRLDGDTGWRTLAHEVVHVLQQTGPRPLGASDDRPVVGAPGRGLRFDPVAEAEADTLANQDEGLVVVPVALRGMQPSFVDTGQRFIDYLLHAERARPEIDRIEATGSGTGGVLIGREVRDDVAHLGQAIGRWIDAFGRAVIEPRVASTFGPAAREIKAWLTARKSDINNAMNDLAIDASETARRRDDATESPEMELRVEGFERKLQRFVMVATGCSLDFELRKLANGRLNRADPLISGRFVGMNLALVADADEGRALWDKMMRNTFPAALRNDPHVRAMARILLFARGLGEGAWNDTSFALDNGLAGQIRNEANVVSGLRLPPADAFWHGATAPGSLAATDPALWIGLHGDPNQHSMPDRQSHHTTQFLLVQYFELDHARKPLPNPAQRDARGWLQGQLAATFSSNHIESLGGIQVGSLDPNSQRGAGMPAILMAAVTHRRGYLHVVPVGAATEDDEVPARATQGAAVEQWFQTGLEVELGESVADDYVRAVEATYATPLAGATAPAAPAALDPGAAPVPWLEAHATELARAIPAAMRHTYREMKAVMLDQIEPALQTLEVQWYRELAVAQGDGADPAYQVRRTHWHSVAEAAINNNAAVMETRAHWS